MNIATNKTGANSFSGIAAIFGVVSGAASALQAITTSGTDAHQAIFGGGGIILALGSTVAKLFHDKGIHVATIQAAGSDVAAQLPAIKTDISRTISFIEQDVPGLTGLVTDAHTAVSSLASRVAAVEAKAIPTISDIEATVRTVLSSILGSAAVPAAAPVAPGTAPIQVTTTETPVIIPASA